MSTELVLHRGPREELARLQADLADRELFLTNLQAELRAFQRRYIREIAPLYAELDDWSARIIAWLEKNKDVFSAAYEEWDQKIEALAAEEPNLSRSPHPRRKAKSNAAEPPAVSEQANGEEEFSASSDLKTLYREVAKRVHPDLAISEADRRNRELLMKRANTAYESGNQAELRAILEDYENSPESVKGHGPDADLSRLTRQIKQIKNRLIKIEQEIANFIDSDTGKLKAKADMAKVEGRDLLAEIATDLRRRIDSARRDAQARRVALEKN